MNKPSPEIASDIDRFKLAMQALSAGDPHTARGLFQEIASHTPATYDYISNDGDVATVRCWNIEEFTLHIGGIDPEKRPTTVWKPGIYPQAHYYLGFIDVHEGNFASAKSHLAASLRLEPDQPITLCEMAHVHSVTTGDHAGAYELYHRALTARRHITSFARARALRGMGAELIELRELDRAASCFRESLGLDPESSVAREELAYIEHLRAGGRPNPMKTVIGRESTNTSCSVCGNAVGDKYTARLEDGNLRYICSQCSNASGKRWWEFWK